ncbi:MAG: hypothetical protein RL531_1034 [Actinomycetota bacterium]|jgi:DNA recombination protein RmuC
MVIGIIIGVLIGALAVFAWHATSVSSMRAKVEAAERTARTEAQILESVKAAQNEALQGSGQMLVALAEEKMNTSTAKVETVVKPVAEQLKALQERLGKVEEQRVADSSQIKEMVKGLHDATNTLQRDTLVLATAMRDTRVRGDWGEQQLLRIVELAGLLEHCDYDEQRRHSDDDGVTIPDLIVRLPEGKAIVIDSKVPFDSFANAVEAVDPAEEQRLLGDHAKRLLVHAQTLAKRQYSTRVPGSIDFVVMFVPGEASLPAALRARPQLFEEAAELNVILTSASTLLALLRSIAYGWRQDQLAQNAREIEELGSEMLKRLRTFTQHFVAVGRALGSSVSAFNSAVGSLETSVAPQARRMQEYGAGRQHALHDAKLLEPPREIVKPELLELDDGAPGLSDGA